MAVSKYSNLPGIDTDQPDVYETKDLPEADQAQLNLDDQSESVEKLNVSTSDAYTKFKGKQLNAEGIDFSDRLSRSQRIGYSSSKTEYEILGQGSGMKETPEQKHQRLQHEIRELAEEVNKAKEAMQSEAASEAVAPAVLSKQAEYLHQQLLDLRLDEVLGKADALKISDPEGALQKRLLTEIEAFTTQAPASDKAKPKGGEGAASDQITYQLYYKQEQTKFSNNAKVADIEQRLERVEALLGNNPAKLSSLVADTQNRNLVEAVAHLSMKVRMLEPGQLDQVDGRVQVLLQKLSQIAEKKEALENAEKQNKVMELFDLIKKWNSMANSLPHVVDRLCALKELHEQALQFNQSLTQLEATQEQITGCLNSHGDMLKQVKTTLGENLATIKTSCENLDARIKALKK